MQYRITFLLPGNSALPVGGFKVVYEYANHLAEKGHIVTVINPCVLDKQDAESTIRTKISYFSRSLGLRGGYKPRRWFAVNPMVNVYWRYNLQETGIPDADFVFATAWQTAEWLNEYGPAKGRKFYLIHDYEHFMVADQRLKERIAETFHFGFNNIVTSPAGEMMLESIRAPICAKISNGIDFDIFNLQHPIDSSQRTLIGFPARAEEFKGTRDALAAVEKIKSAFKDQYSVWAFGPVRIPWMPSWIDFHHQPSAKTIAQLMNRTAVFILPSHYEGWGLPGAESMACGASLVTTDNIGVRDYASDGETALFSNINEPTDIAIKVSRLLDDREYRTRLASKGYIHIQNYTWDRAIGELLRVLEQKIHTY